jgi:hypothetical protein
MKRSQIACGPNARETSDRASASDIAPPRLRGPGGRPTPRGGSKVKRIRRRERRLIGYFARAKLALGGSRNSTQGGLELFCIYRGVETGPLGIVTRNIGEGV